MILAIIVSVAIMASTIPPSMAIIGYGLHVEHEDHDGHVYIAIVGILLLSQGITCILQ